MAGWYLVFEMINAAVPAQYSSFATMMQSQTECEQVATAINAVAVVEGVSFHGACELRQ